MAIRPPGFRSVSTMIAQTEFACLLPVDYRISRLPVLPPPPPPPPGLPCSPFTGAFSHGTIPPFMPRCALVIRNNLKRKYSEIENPTDSLNTVKESCEILQNQEYVDDSTRSSSSQNIKDFTIEEIKSSVTDCDKVIGETLNLSICNEELKIPSEMLQPLYCKLCGTQLNGTLQANAHYDGKNHKKKERLYLEKLRKENGIKLALQQLNEKLENEKKEVKPEDMYCKLCDAAFNSDVQAKQHYNGRNHKRRVQGDTQVSKGFFNPTTGKWQRPIVISSSPPPPTKTSPVTKKKQKFICTICNSTMTSQMQLDAHLVGAKHKSKVAQHGFRDVRRSESFSTATGTVDSILATVIATEVEEPCAKRAKTSAVCRDFSMFRTPSGKYYCSTCNLTLNSESQFAQHFESKKHKAKTNAQRYADVTLQQNCV